MVHRPAAAAPSTIPAHATAAELSRVMTAIKGAEAAAMQIPARRSMAV
jgi:hypothetical protein